MVICFFITVILYLFAYYIFSHIKSYSEDDYYVPDIRHSWDKKLKEDAVPKRMKLKLWIIILAIIGLLVPCGSIIFGVALAICAFIPLDSSGYKYYPGKITGGIYNFFSNIFSKEF